MTRRTLPSFWVYRDKQGHWRWNLVAADGKIIAASSVAYFRKEGCFRAVNQIKKSAHVPVYGPATDHQINPNDSAPKESLPNGEGSEVDNNPETSAARPL